MKVDVMTGKKDDNDDDMILNEMKSSVFWPPIITVRGMNFSLPPIGIL